MESFAPYPHFGWAFGEKEYSSPAEAQTMDFRFWFNPALSSPPFDFRDECLNAARMVDEKRVGRKVALCYSGGLRSETIAFCLKELGIPFNAYFLDIWGVNGRIFREQREAFERKYQTIVKVVRIERQHFYDQVSRQLFKKFGVGAPTYLAMTELFRAIPENQFIVTGDGDLQRQGRAYEFWGRVNPDPAADSVAFLPSSIFYYLWSREAGRAGEFYFFRSTPELVAAQARHPGLEMKHPFVETNEIFAAAFPEIAPREKSNNWSREGYQENVWIREWLEQCVREERIAFWRDDAGAAVSLSGIFN